MRSLTCQRRSQKENLSRNSDNIADTLANKWQRQPMERALKRNSHRIIMSFTFKQHKEHKQITNEQPQDGAFAKEQRIKHRAVCVYVCK